MLIWESEMKDTDKETKWTGENGFIDFKAPLWVRGLRFIMDTTE